RNGKLTTLTRRASEGDCPPRSRIGLVCRTTLTRRASFEVALFHHRLMLLRRTPWVKHASEAFGGAVGRWAFAGVQRFPPGRLAQQPAERLYRGRARVASATTFSSPRGGRGVATDAPGTIPGTRRSLA